MSENLLIPVKRLRKGQGTCPLPARATFLSPRSADALPLKQLAGDLARLGVRAHIVFASCGPATARFRRDPALAGRDSYRIDIAPDGIEIASATDGGAFYAVQTLRELVRIHGRTLPVCSVEDRPDFDRRGVYLDCSRGKVPTIKTLQALVERLAAWKVNELQLYVENVFTFASHPDIGRGYSPFTPVEMIALQDFCKARHVRLVGSLASFGHMERILCLPKYRRLGEMPGFRGLPGGTTLCPGDPGATRLVADLYEEFLPLHEAEDFNVCCDETWELGRGRSKGRAGRVGVGRVYLEFLLKLHRLCRRYGKRMNAWADIVLEHPDLLGELPRDIVMLNWEYNADGPRIRRTREITDAGLPCVVCPGTSGWRAHGARLANSIANVANFAAEGRRRGAEGLLNTDWGDGGHRNLLGASLHGFAHAAAHAWNGRAVDDASFTRTFCFHVFGRRDARLAGAIRTLGDSHLASPGCLYEALVEPLETVRDFQKGLLIGSPVRWPRTDAIAKGRPAGLRRIAARLSVALPRMNAPKGLDRFEAMALDELALAARMDILAARRSLAGQELRNGRKPAAATFRALADEMHAVAGDFRRLWLARNRPSRLKDNLTLMARAERECRELARS